MGSLGFGFGARGGRVRENGADFSAGGASHLIRSAERLAASGRFDFAVEQLTVAQRLDPGNRYIQAIIDRIRVKQNVQSTSNPEQMTSADRHEGLSVTVGPQFATGLRSTEDDSRLSPEDVHTKIRFLTNMANQYLDNGSSERAFESLMKAYLLDPLSPYVIATEKNVLPAWDFTRAHMNRSDSGSSRAQDFVIDNLSHLGTTHMSSSNSSGIPSQFASLPSQASSSSQPIDEQMRMETLRQQKEQERLEKERTVWREASRIPKTYGEDDSTDLTSPTQESGKQPKPQSTGLFSKLRLGKFLE